MKKVLQTKKILTLAILLQLLLSGSVFASHSMGGDLTYQCMGGNTYKITIKFYRDCIGSPAPTNPHVDITSPSCGQNLGINLNPIAGTGQEITPVCSSSVTTCNGGSYTGIQEWVYEGTVTLPAQCPDWIFGYSQCCRNAAITTINNPNTNTFYLEATLNNTISPCNSSPTFSNIPVPFLCLGQQFCFNHGAFDPDGDSLAYQLIVPRQTPTTTVTYIAPYSPSNPLNSSPAASFNAVTGDICLTPQNLEVTVTAVLVNEYRNGVLIGSVERDLQLIVMNCTNNIPTLTGVNGSSSFNTTVCANQQNCFTVFSSDPDNGQQLTVSWNFGISAANFSTSPAGHPTGSFCWTPTTADIGHTYTFTATVSDDACPYNGSQTFSYTVSVTGISVFAGSDQIVNCNNQATLTANVSGGSGGYSYQWNNGATTQSITVGAGTYIVTASNGSCSANDTVTITGTPPPVVNAGTDKSICKGVSVTLSASGASAYTWSPGGGASGTSSISVSPTATTSYTVTGTDANGCTATDLVVVNVLSLPVANAGPDANICPPGSAFLSATGGVSYTWNPGSTNNQSITVSPASNQVYSVTVTAANGCTSTDSVQVNVRPGPSLTLSSFHICSGNSSVLDAGNPGCNYSWSTGATTQSIQVNSGGNYSVTITDTYGCTASSSSSITYGTPIIVSLNSIAFCQGDSMMLDAGNPGLSFAWTPGGQTSQTIKVKNAGTYGVTVTDNYGCSAANSTNAVVYPLPVADFIALPACHGDPMNFNDRSFVNSGSIGTWEWDFGDGDTSTMQNPVHQYDSAGQYAVQLHVTSQNGCKEQVAINMDVYRLPSARFSAPNECSGTPVSFTNISTSQDGFITSNLWTFGDGNTSYDINPVHQYADSGRYTINLLTISSYGCMGRYMDSLLIYGNPTVNIQMNNNCSGTPVQFNASSNQGNINYAWNLGNGYNTTSPAFSYTFNNAGSYNVSLTATSTTGCTGTTTNQLSIYPTPVPAFATNDVCQLSPTNFSNYSSVASGSIASYSWNFGDNQQSNQNNPSHTYNSSGVFNAALSVVTDHGCTSVFTRQVSVHPNPTVNFNAGMQGCGPINAGFTDASSLSSGNISGYLWNFGDGEVSTDHFPHHVYDEPGNYDVTLTVVSDFGCQANYTRPNIIRVFPDPVTNFVADPMITDLDMPYVHFQNNSQNFTSYQWTFGDGSYTTSEMNPTHTFRDTGIYNAMLVTINNYGCRDTIMRRIEVKLHSTLFLANSFTPNGDGTNDTFRPYYTNMENLKVWIFDRWGKLITTWDGLEGSWDGFYQGRKCQQDTYVVKVVGKGVDGTSSEWVGHVNIIN